MLLDIKLMGTKYLAISEVIFFLLFRTLLLFLHCLAAWKVHAKEKVHDNGAGLLKQTLKPILSQLLLILMVCCLQHSKPQINRQNYRQWEERSMCHFWRTILLFLGNLRWTVKVIQKLKLNLRFKFIAFIYLPFLHLKHECNKGRH